MSDNDGPKSPREFLKELQRNKNETENESAAQPNSIEPPPYPVESATYQDQIETIQSAAIAAIAQLTNKAQTLVFDLDMELREARRQNKDLSAENGKMILQIEALNDTIASRDTTIKELMVRIERFSLSSEKAKLQTAQEHKTP